MQNAANPTDGQFVVIQNGQRVTGTTANQQEAEEEANRRNRLVEASGQPVRPEAKAQVKRNLCG